MILGGVAIPSEFGLEGHSDADILSHAITDALLGALALGDIGMHFPDTDPRWKDGDSLLFLRHARELVAAQGYQIANVDSTVILERPKLKDYRGGHSRESWPRRWVWRSDQVSVKFKTAERLGPVGEGLSAEAQAVVLISAASRLDVDRCSPPGPKNPPIVGNLYAFRSNPLGFLIKAAREYGDLVYFKVARQHMYLVNHPDYVREVLVNNQSNFIKSRALQRAKDAAGRGIAHQRRAASPAAAPFGAAGVSSRAAGGLCGCDERTRGAVCGNAGKPEARMDVSIEMAHLTLSVVAKTLFSADVESEASEIGAGDDHAFSRCSACC